MVWRYLTIAFFLVTAQVLVAKDTLEVVASLAKIDAFLDEELYDSAIAFYFTREQQELVKSYSCAERGRIAHKIGVSYYLGNQEYQAIQLFKQAVRHFDACPELSPTEVANTLYNIGVSYQYTPDILQGKQYITQALHTLSQQADVDTLDLAYKYEGAGAYFAAVNDWNQAQSYYQNAKYLFEQLQGQESEIFYLSNLLLVLYVDFQKYDLAKQEFKRAIEYASKSNIPTTSADYAYINLNGAIAYVETSRLDTALLLLENAQYLLDDQEHIDLYSNSLELEGVIYTKQAKYQQAKKLYDSVLNIRMRQSPDLFSDVAQAIAHENLSEWHSLNNQFVEANQYLDSAMSHVFRLHSFDKQNNPIIGEYLPIDATAAIRILSAKTEILATTFTASHDVKDLHQQLVIHNKIDSIINLNIFNLAPDGSKIEWYDLSTQHYQKAINLALQIFELTADEMYLEKAIHFSSLSKSLVLQQHLQESNALDHKLSLEGLGILKSALSTFNAVKENIKLYPENKDSLLVVFVEAQTRLAIVRDSLITGERTSYAISSIDLGEIQSKLPENALIVDYFVTDEDIIVFGITRKQRSYSRISISDTLNELIAHQIAACHDPSKDFEPTKSYDLFKTLFPENLLYGDTHFHQLYIIPDGTLYELPFESLIIDLDQMFLIEQSAVVYNYSLALLKLGLPVTKQYNYIGFGTNYSSSLVQNLNTKTYLWNAQHVPNFSLAEEEILQASKIFQGHYYIGEDATIGNFVEQAKKGTILHLSLHGFVDYSDPTRSCILFDDRSEPMLLTPDALQAHQIEPSITILSSCNTASGKQYSGEGIHGMTRAFLFSGAHAVISSLWSSTENFSLELFKNFLSQVKKGKNISNALQIAKSQYLQAASPRFRHPYYWSNYILVGNFSYHPSMSLSRWAVLASLLLIVSTIYFFLKNRPQK